MNEIELYRQMMSKDPSSQVFVYLAESLWEREMYEEAIEICVNGLRLHPHELRARVILGQSYLRTGELDRAETELLKAKEMLEINAVAYKALAELHEVKGEIDQATFYRQLFERIHPAQVPEPESEPAETEIERLPQEIEQEEEEVATNTIAELYVEQGHLGKAIEVYRRILSSGPEAEGVTERIAELEKLMGKGQAVQTLLSILQSWQSKLQDRAASDITSPATEPTGIDPEKLAALMQKYVKRAETS